MECFERAEGRNALERATHVADEAQPAEVGGEKARAAEINSASVILRAVLDCFLIIHAIGNHVFDPRKHINIPLVDFASRKSPAKLASENIISWQSFNSSPTQQYWVQSLV